jgi:drug/metabolite transporter (DMT)-like permease
MPAVSSSPPRVYSVLALATIIWGANFNLVKHVLADMDALTAAAARFDIAALVMIVICLVRGERIPLLRHGVAYATLGLVGICGFNVLFFFGMRSTSAVNGALIMAGNPLLTAALAFALTGVRLNWRQIAALPIACAGVAFVVLGGGAHWQLERGDLLLLGASLSWALYNVLVGQRLPRDVSSLANTTGVMTAGAVGLSALALVDAAPIHVPGTDALVSLLLMSLGGSVLAYLFWNAAIARVGASRAALFINLVPVSSMVIAALEGQAPTWAQQVGGAVVIGAVLVASWPVKATPALRVEPAPRAALSRCDA